MHLPKAVTEAIAAASNLAEPAVYSAILLAKQTCRKADGRNDMRTRAQLESAETLYLDIAETIMDAIEGDVQADANWVLELMAVADDLATQAGVDVSLAEPCKHLTDPIPVCVDSPWVQRIAAQFHQLAPGRPVIVNGERFTIQSVEMEVEQDGKSGIPDAVLSVRTGR